MSNRTIDLIENGAQCKPATIGRFIAKLQGDYEYIIEEYQTLIYLGGEEKDIFRQLVEDTGISEELIRALMEEHWQGREQP
ncbi:hypothetical protein GP475_08890 [Corynebacterium poyangense]|uniref:Uncharacterized protein n=1 Tax=Corynebacterium poyangense TaxID=2684405 RepID=A0A7H0SQB7_9CORY|nr:hypothetical protein [Corynebacterium poyangense]QNQ90742.1 hypothetical protein GP475_08890 [Corynebacterium poyangense]